MKDFLLIVWSVFFMQFKLYAQFTCGTTTLNAVSQNANAQSAVVTPLAAQSDGTYAINIYFHIIRLSNGTGGVNASGLPGLATLITNAYSSHHIKIVNAGYDYINSDTYANFQDALYNNLIAVNNKANAINIYLLYNNPTAYGGKTDAIPGHSIVIANVYALTQVVVHETGHSLGLFHTFHGQESGSCPELANESNCTTCGDYICDTPADPYNPSSGQPYPSNSNCVYTGPVGYTPDVTDYMTYSLPSCLNHFTAGQESRMTSSLSSASVLQPVILSISGVTAFCTNATYTINNYITGGTVVWSASPAGVLV